VHLAASFGTVSQKRPQRPLLGPFPFGLPRGRLERPALHIASAPVHTIKLTETRKITPYKWVQPNDERQRCRREPERRGNGAIRPGTFPGTLRRQLTGFAVL
jgi:hypothetical protein